MPLMIHMIHPRVSLSTSRVDNSMAATLPPKEGVANGTVPMYHTRQVVVCCADALSASIRRQKNCSWT